jgi:hypothetical protein
MNTVEVGTPQLGALQISIGEINDRMFSRAFSMD